MGRKNGCFCQSCFLPGNTTAPEEKVQVKEKHNAEVNTKAADLGA